MTLVMTMGIGSLFTVMTSDERIAYNIQGKLYPIEDERVVKTHQLTDTVLFGWGGDYATSLEIKEKLSKVISPEDTLNICKQHLEQITNGMEFTRDVAIILSGFYLDGMSGMVMKRSNKPVQELKTKQLEYRYTMFPPTGDYSDRQNDLLYIEEFTPNYIVEEFPEIGLDEWLKKSIEIAVNHLIKLHGIISYKEPVATRPEGFYYLMYKDSRGIIRTASGEYDTSKIHEQLRLDEGTI